MPRFPLDGKVALVTGAMRGIGYETAKALHARGASVVLTDIDAALTEAAATGIGARAIGLAADVRDEAAVEAAVAVAVQRFGGLDVVVANAGIAGDPAQTLVAAERHARRLRTADGRRRAPASADPAGAARR